MAKMKEKYMALSALRPQRCMSRTAAKAPLKAPIPWNPSKAKLITPLLSQYMPPMAIIKSGKEKDKPSIMIRSIIIHLAFVLSVFAPFIEAIMNVDAAGGKKQNNSRYNGGNFRFQPGRRIHVGTAFRQYCN